MPIQITAIIFNGNPTASPTVICESVPPACPLARPLAREGWLWQGSNDTGDHYGRSFAGSKVSGFTATL